MDLKLETLSGVLRGDVLVQIHCYRGDDMANMIAVAQEVLARNEARIDDVSLVLMHQANKRINEYCQKALGIPDSKVLHNIERYGNTTAATIPLLWDEAARAGRVAPGDLVLLVAFGAGMNWGATLVRA